MKTERYYHGIAVAPGIAQGVVFRYLAHQDAVPVREISEDEISTELQRFEEARRAAQTEIMAIRKQMIASIGKADASLFDAHLLLLEDPMLLKEVQQTLRKELLNIEHIFSSIMKRSCSNLNKVKNPYLRDRILDLEDVTGRVLQHLVGKSPKFLNTLSEDYHVIIAHALRPSEAAMLHYDPVIAFATETGSKTSHTAIIARALGIPAVVGLKNVVSEVSDGDTVLLDGHRGLLIVNPSKETQERYRELRLQQKTLEQELEALRETSPITRDGYSVTLSANSEISEDAKTIIQSGAEGIGLYRTEFLFLNRQEPPQEEELYQTFKKLAESVQPHHIIVRTLDCGADKPIEALSYAQEANPFLGCRGIRFCLQHKEFFKVQLRAILRAAVGGNLRMMYPMISGVEELREANAVLEEAKEELRHNGIPFREDIEVGIMMEVPSAAMTADLLAKEAAFFSIGTNDLIQYLLSVDRGNESVAYLYNPAHASVIRMLKRIIDAAHDAGIWVGLCGELAGDLLFTPLLIGLGIDELSVSAPLVPRIKKAIQSLDVSSCQELIAQTINSELPGNNQKACADLAESCYGFLL